MINKQLAIIWKLGGGLLAFALLGWIILNFVGLVAYEKVSFNRTFTEPITSLDIGSGAGSVTVIGDRESGVELEAHGNAGLSKNRHSEVVENNVLKIRTECYGIGISRCDLHYTLHVPPTFVVAGKADNGRMKIVGMRARVDLRSDNGRIEVQNSSGDMRLESNNGIIRVIDSRSKRVEMKSDNGSIRASFLESPDHVEADANNGTITVEVPENGQKYQTETHSNNGSIRNGLLIDSTSSKSIKANSNNGSITLRYFKDPVIAAPTAPAPTAPAAPLN